MWAWSILTHKGKGTESWFPVPQLVSAMGRKKPLDLNAEESRARPDGRGEEAQE